MAIKWAKAEKEKTKYPIGTPVLRESQVFEQVVQVKGQLF